MEVYQKSLSCHPGLDPGSHTTLMYIISMSWRIKSAMTKLAVVTPPFFYQILPT